MDTTYEAAAFEQMLKQARRCARLEMALEDARTKLKVIQRKLAPGSRTFDELMHDVGIADDLARGALARIDGVLEESKP